MASRSISPSARGRFASSTFFKRSASPTRSYSPISSSAKKPIASTASRRPCLCSPTTHPGSFRCSLHKCFHPRNASPSTSSSSLSTCLSVRRSGLVNSLARIGALAALIRPSSHHQRRRNDFQPRPSRLSVMSTAAADP